MDPKQQHDIFLSYSRSNKSKALSIFELLGQQGWVVFMDENIPNGKRWKDYLNQQLDTVKCVLVLWSKEAIASEWVLKEAHKGLERQVLVHATLDGTVPPLEFTAHQYNDLSGWNEEIDVPQFKKVLQGVAEYIGAKGSLGTLPVPKDYEQVSEDHIALTSTSWLHTDPKKNADFPYQIHLRLVAKKVVMEKIQRVTYYFEPEYAKNNREHVDPNLKAYVRISDKWRNGFSVYELASGYTLVRADVKVRGQARIVSLSRIVDMMEQGPWLKHLYKRWPDSSVVKSEPHK